MFANKVFTQNIKNPKMTGIQTSGKKNTPITIFKSREKKKKPEKLIKIGFHSKKGI
jgi:hypothetical protein